MGQDMTRDQIMAQLGEIFCDVFDDEDIIISENLTAEDVEEWDSLSHITMVLTLESEFSIKLKAAEVGNLANVGSLIDIISARLAA